MSSHSSNQTVSDALLDVKQNTNRLPNIKRFGFGLVIITLLLSIVLPYTIGLIIAAALLAVSTVFYPQILSPLYGLLLSPLSIIFNLVLAVFFYTVLSPLAIFLRWLGFDLLQQNLQPEVESYWIERKTILPHGRYMTNQN